MAVAWEQLIWWRRSRFQIELPIHGPSLATLIKLIAKNHVFIADLDVEKQAATVALAPDVLTYRPAVISIVLRTRNRGQEEQILKILASFGYAYLRSKSEAIQTGRNP